jgi:hypothetical protein
MRKPLTATLLLAGHLLVGTLAPVAARAETPPPSGPHHASSHDDHYRCMYHCAARGYPGYATRAPTAAGSRPSGD